MSAQMCIVPTKGGDVEVPVGTLIWLNEAFLMFADKGGYQPHRNDVGDGNPLPYGDRVATIVAVPDGNGGWITPGATPEPEWVALTEEQVALLPDRALVRVECGGVVTEGALHRERTRIGGVNLHHSGGYWWAGDMPDVTVYARQQDVPDPDADLIERAARAAYEATPFMLTWDEVNDRTRGPLRAAARAVIAMVRGEQA